MFDFSNMTAWQGIGQILGFLAIATEFVIYQQKTKKGLILVKLIADLIWTTHFLLIGGWTGAATTAVAIFREIVFYFSSGKKWAQHKAWVVLFSCVFFSCSILTWKGIYSLFPAICSVISTVAFRVNSPRKTKLLQIPSVVAMLIYNGIILSYAGMINGVLSLASIIIFFLREGWKKRKGITPAKKQ